MEQELMIRAKQSLYNPEEITEQMVEIALKEAKELTQNKPLPEPMIMDLAMFRLKLLLKIEPTELDLILMKEALKMAEKIEGESGELITQTIYGIRKSEF
ncbi:hypothetical protein [Campylobacter corcagiensis]|uniref:Uncharacterized protein n=1 Tax=Campylobacter corcagiensis TaxID=1448857 RepID=A0A7M1LG29_9BACT|nr:hypothetical protein [Campylobacter corcagiensis]QKF64565.1 hypothetical protein CCORG_0704 [Campylobacter corcagiensis]QOQ87261.1 hypothetical protein IMC76_08650 [Campylobacter corcagiensis]